MSVANVASMAGLLSVGLTKYQGLSEEWAIILALFVRRE